MSAISSTFHRIGEARGTTSTVAAINDTQWFNVLLSTRDAKTTATSEVKGSPGFDVLATRAADRVDTCCDISSSTSRAQHEGGSIVVAAPCPWEHGLGELG
jgi:hypothetical protein